MFVADLSRVKLGQVVGDGHCVAFVREVSRAPRTAVWRAGTKARLLARRLGGGAEGTVIATFHPETGRYENDTKGRSHAAILLEVRPDGLRVFDQWVGRPVAERVIRFKGGKQPHVDDGDTYAVVEEARAV